MLGCAVADDAGDRGDVVTDRDVEVESRDERAEAAADVDAADVGVAEVAVRPGEPVAELLDVGVGEVTGRLVPVVAVCPVDAVPSESTLPGKSIGEPSNVSSAGSSGTSKPSG